MSKHKKECEEFSIKGVLIGSYRLVVTTLSAMLIAIISFYGSDVYKTMKDINKNMAELSVSMKYWINSTKEIKIKVDNNTIKIYDNEKKITVNSGKIENNEKNINELKIKCREK